MMKPYPDPEAIIRAILLAEFEFAAIARTMPAVDGPWPYVRVEELGSGGERELTFSPIVDVDVFTLTVEEAKTLSRSISTRLLGYASRVMVEDRVVILAKSLATRSPASVPYEDSSIARWGATYQLGLRR